MTIKIGIVGANGKMGQKLIEIGILQTPQSKTVLVAVHSRSSIAQEFLYVKKSRTIEELISESDVIIDFTSPEYSMKVANACAFLGKALVCGTTGFDDVQSAELLEISCKIPLLLSPNMSIGITFLHSALSAFKKHLQRYKGFISELHHKTKKDSPSGTAKLLGEAIDAESIVARRAGENIGEHSVLLIGDYEVLELQHRVVDRKIFALGAYTAAEYIASRRPALYSMADVLEL